MEKLTPYQIWQKVEKDNLTKDEHKQLLIDNGILITNSDERGFCQIKAYKNGKCTLYVDRKCNKCPIWQNG